MGLTGIAGGGNKGTGPSFLQSTDILMLLFTVDFT